METIHDELLVMIFELAGKAVYYPIVRTCWRWRRLFRKPMNCVNYIVYAASCGEMHIVQWAVTERVRIDFAEFAPMVAYSGNIEFLKWVCNNTYVASLNAYDAEKSNINILQCIMKGESYRGSEPNLELYDLAYSRMGKIPSKSVMRIGRRGSLELLKWLLSVDLDAKYHEYLICNITYSNHLHLLQYLLGIEKFVYNRSYVSSAIRGGAKDVLQWFIDMGYEMPKKCVEDAFESRQYEMARWLADKGCRIKGTENSFVIHACHVNDMELLDWILKVAPDCSNIESKWAKTTEQLDKMRAAGCKMKYVNEVPADEDLGPVVEMLEHSHGTMSMSDHYKSELAMSNNDALKRWAISKGIIGPTYIFTLHSVKDFTRYVKK